jgi:hypothetical protein
LGTSWARYSREIGIDAARTTRDRPRRDASSEGANDCSTGTYREKGSRSTFGSAVSPNRPLWTSFGKPRGLLACAWGCAAWPHRQPEGRSRPCGQRKGCLTPPGRGPSRRDRDGPRAANDPYKKLSFLRPPCRVSVRIFLACSICWPWLNRPWPQESGEGVEDRSLNLLR